MRGFRILLALCALPATVSGQTAICEACDHVAPVFRGGGGLIGTVADGADKVTFVTSCGNVWTTGEAQVQGGKASLLFNHRNGLTCDQPGGTLEIGGLVDGGWYWITDESSTAVGNLVGKDILDNETVEVTNPGAGVSMTVGRGAVFLKESSSGRVGILPNILPRPKGPGIRKCGFDDRGAGAEPRYTRRDMDCLLGDGETVTLATSRNAFTGAVTRLGDGVQVLRPGGDGTLAVTIDLWGNGSGHIVSATDGNPVLGHEDVAFSELRADARLAGVTYQVRLGTGPLAATIQGGGAAVGGVAFDSSTANVAVINIRADTEHCDAGNGVDVPATVFVTAAMEDPNDTGQMTPHIVRNPLTGEVGGTSFTVVCSVAGAGRSSISPTGAGYRWSNKRSNS